jgi:hypothetical protein
VNEKLPKEIEPQLPYDVEVEKKRLEVYQDIQRGWQEKLTEITGIIKEAWASGKEIERKIVLYIFGLVGLFFVGTAILTAIGVVPGEAFTFLLGIIVGYLLSITPIRAPKGA